MEEGLVKMDNQQLLKRFFAFMAKIALSVDERLEICLGQKY
jgi:hypothetical protein